VGFERIIGVVRGVPQDGEDAPLRADWHTAEPQAERVQSRLDDKPPGSAAGTRGIDVPVGMVVGLVHELNNLMTVIAASVRQASARPSEEKQAAELARANCGIERAKQLTQRILSFARNPIATSLPSDLGQLVRELETLIAQTVGSGIELGFDLTSDPLRLYVDAAQFELALLNLVRNAADAMPHGGTLTISAAGWALPQFVAVTVADTGEGMGPEALQRATEPFFTTKSRGSGTGLGLSFVQHFAETAGGWLEIDSSPGRGTRITIVLPAATAMHDGNASSLKA
jgi:signal transduction histidine kinase